MKIFKKVKIPARIAEECIYCKCDICGKKGKYDDDGWSSNIYHVNETEIKVTIKQKEGHSCPDGGSGTQHEIDLCPECFKKKLIPWLRSQGAEVKEEEWSW